MKIDIEREWGMFFPDYEGRVDNQLNDRLSTDIEKREGQGPPAVIECMLYSVYLRRANLTLMTPAPNIFQRFTKIIIPRVLVFLLHRGALVLGASFP